tara:strand:- start:144 stop:635 length:492 start_codon:yes stop_codon:yes gene_type:complete
MKKKTFNDYQNFILHHKNYQFIKSHKNTWVKASKKGENPRRKYWNDKQQELIEQDIMKYLLKNKRDITTKILLNCYNTKCISYKIDNIIIDENGNIQFTSSEKISTKKTKETQQQRIFEILLVDCKDNRKLKKKLIHENKIKEECNEITIENFKITVCKILQM